jgi:hypothetical protein
MKVVTLKNIPEVPAPGAAEPTDGYAGPVHRTGQTIIEAGESANFNGSVADFRLAAASRNIGSDGLMG